MEADKRRRDASGNTVSRTLRALPLTAHDRLGGECSLPGLASKDERSALAAGAVRSGSLPSPEAMPARLRMEEPSCGALGWRCGEWRR